MRVTRRHAVVACLSLIVAAGVLLSAPVPAHAEAIFEPLTAGGTYFYNPWPVLNWSSRDDAGGTIQWVDLSVSNHQSFSPELGSAQLKANTWTPRDGFLVGDYYWRGKAYSAGGGGRMSETRVFRIVQGPTTTASALAVSATSVPYNGKATLSWTLKLPLSGDALFPSRDMEIQTSADDRNWKRFTTISSATGLFSLPVQPTVKTYYRAVYMGTATHSWTVSNSVAVTPGAKISVPTHPTRYGRNRTFKSYGYLWPRHASPGSVTIRCFRYEPGTKKWVWRKTVQTTNSYYSSSTATKYVGSVSLPSAGYWRLMAVHSVPDGHPSIATRLRSCTNILVN